MGTTAPTLGKKTLISKDSALAVLAVEVARRHRPVVTGEAVTCRACGTAWMCPAHSNAEDTLRAAGLSLRDHDGCDDTVESGLEAVPLGSDQTQRITPRKPTKVVLTAAAHLTGEAQQLDSDQTQRITPAPSTTGETSTVGRALAIREPKPSTPDTAAA